MPEAVIAIPCYRVTADRDSKGKIGFIDQVADEGEGEPFVLRWLPPLPLGGEGPFWLSEVEPCGELMIPRSLIAEVWEAGAARF